MPYSIHYLVQTEVKSNTVYFFILFVRRLLQKNNIREKEQSEKSFFTFDKSPR